MSKPGSTRIARARLPKFGASLAAVGAVILLGACSGGAPSPAELRRLATETHGMTGDPAAARDAKQVVPDSDPLVKLGQLLFFSQTLAAGYDVSCGTCHHTDFGGTDGLSLSVGPIPKNPATVGPGREIDPHRDLDPSADGGPNMHRNSITSFNAALFDRSLMFDGRVFVLDAQTVPGGHGQKIRTPESGQAPDVNPLDGLMEFTMKGPIVNDNEMRSFFYTDLPTPADYREHLMQRLRGNVDTQYNPIPEAPANWLERFRAAFGQPEGQPEELITMLNVQRALAAYIKSQIFVDTPWRNYLEGDDKAISRDAREGARLFLSDVSEGGLGCVNCHAGDRFSDEAFHNVAFPQFGRGFGRAQRSDVGRWFETRMDEDMQAFRTPSLLNVAVTAPYGHVGAFATLEEVLAYHANPREAVESYDFTLSHLPQFKDGKVEYPHAERFTRDALSRANFAAAEQLLPARNLTRGEIRQLVAFLGALTDRCVADRACISRWAPSPADDPDGHTLVRDRAFGTPESVEGAYAAYKAPEVPLQFTTPAPRETFADVVACTNNVGKTTSSGKDGFVLRRPEDVGLVDGHGYRHSTWFRSQQSALEVAMMAGGVTAAYLDDDCWPDLVFSGGDVSGMVFYRNQGGKRFSRLDVLADTSEREFSGAALADLNGDYRRELILGNVHAGAIPVYSRDGGRYGKVAELPMVRPTFGISFAPLDSTGYPYLYFAHWSGGTGTNGKSPALWRNDGARLYPWDTPARTTSAFIDQRFNFTPKFADFTGDGRIDLVIASDFLTSATLRNVPSDSPAGWHFENDTIKSPITDQNGMGSTLLDIDNDGNLEWFVTSILDHTGVAAGNWGVTGNRMYRSTSTAESLSFVDITDEAGVRDGYWGWGSCAADFNNDGFIDLFHVNGFGYIPDDVATNGMGKALQQHYNSTTKGLFQAKPPRLFINNGDGSMSEKAADWGVAVPSEGRGLACADFDRDGDIDIVVFDHSNRPQYFENRGGSGAGRRFLNVRLVGAAPNTDAIGARVFVTADVGHGRGVQTQMRLSEANSNFNSQNLPDLSFGLGEAGVVSRIRVVWPDGRELSCENVAVNQFLVLDQRAPACPGQPGMLAMANRE